ncbi:Cdk-activating kinase assembly factor MAT1, centre [Heracleum sosnowskyi]|uniref:Cdk-activating kinase assembly factor MAT1, centre n=1 Tax=Heracleum sosnowskyi TaxID=360622 RepID=A0AAD8MG81_9APIA|nr:Cdk-activating kinase assembly factor MAT1, centre [Heracleum sosnowskyi]
MSDDVVAKTFRALVESADRKFARVRDVPVYGRAPNNHYFHKVFKSYMRLWKYQQENRSKLVNSGLQRWEIGEIASRIGQLYFNQYMRTSEARFLLESYIFYEAILNRRYFEGLVKDRGLRFKELRFYARFLLVSVILNRWEMVQVLADRFKALVDDSRANFRETSFKEWKQVVQEIVRFMKAEVTFTNNRPLRYCAAFDSFPASLPCVARFHANKVLKFRDALLTSYHRNEVKYAELTLDAFRMLQCLEWEPSGSFYQKIPAQPLQHGALADQSGTSGLIDINLLADMTDPTLPPNPRKAVLYRPTVTQLIAVLATVVDELPPDSVMLIYLSASGKAGYSGGSHIENFGGSRKPSNLNAVSRSSYKQDIMSPKCYANGNGNTDHHSEKCLWLGPSKNGGSDNLYPADIIPFTRRPLFLIVDSDNSHAFKVLHGAERGETAALILSPLKSTFKDKSGSDLAKNGSQFTFFLTAPLQAFCQMAGCVSSNYNEDAYSDADGIISTAFSEWEVILCTSKSLDITWAQVLSDPFLRRIILRFIFCRAVLTLFCPREDHEQHVPVCLPELPDSLGPDSGVVKAAVVRLANLLNVSKLF